VALLINGITGSTTVPRLVSTTYKFAAFDLPFKLRVTAGGKTTEESIDVTGQIQTAWKLVVSRAAHNACNAYFKSLPRGKTLNEVLVEGDITLHCLIPKEGHQFSELPDAVTAGRDIAIHPDLLLSNDHSELACTLIHELAHIGGATTNRHDPNAGAAEEALKSCQCASHYRENTLGWVHRTTSIRSV
jgi:hypothetical protein